jgi:hypothetical protein
MYHDTNKCTFDLWSPVNEKRNCKISDHSHSELHTQWGRDKNCAIENRAFSGYAKHTQELEDIVKSICAGSTYVELDDDMSASDLAWIKKEVKRRTGATCKLSIGD